MTPSTTRTERRAGAADDPLALARPLSHPDHYALTLPTADGPVLIPIPKDPLVNLRWRERMLLRAEEDEEYRAALRALCAQPCPESFLFWLNAFGWTFVQKRVGRDGRERSVMGELTEHPFITWPCQDEAATDLIRAIRDGHSTAIDKSRDMGATWLIVAVFHWHWQFFGGVNFLEISATEDLVDSAGETKDPDTLFAKHDFLLSKQPPWLVPPHERTYMKIARLDADSTIIGKATTGKKGRGGRKTAALIDEAAFIRELRQLWVTLEATTSCRIVNSTVSGPDFFSKIVRSGKVRVISLPWWDHPTKGRGRYTFKDPNSGEVKISSPWRDAKVDAAIDPREVAQEIDRDHNAAGLVVFDPRVVARQTAMYARPPIYTGFLEYAGGVERDLAIERAREKGHDLAVEWRDADPGSGLDWLHLWCELEEDRLGRWRPNQRRTYVIGIDVGLGLDRSNSTMSIIEVESGAKVGEAASPRHSPDEWARMCALAGYWFGGVRRCAFLIWEANGPGGLVWKVLRTLRYPWFYRQIDEDKLGREVKDEPGWFSNPQSKRDMLLKLAAAMRRDEFRNPSRRALEEAGSYVWYDNGSAGVGEREDDSTGAKAAHGDITIADMLAVYGAEQWHRCAPPEREAPAGSPAERMRRYKAMRSRA